MSKDPHSSITISVPHSLRMAFARRCRKEGVPVSAVIAGFMRNYLNPQQQRNESDADHPVPPNGNLD